MLLHFGIISERMVDENLIFYGILRNVAAVNYNVTGLERRSLHY